MAKKLLYVLIFWGMGVNGFLYLSWLLSPPIPDKVGYWFWIYLLVFPYLGLLGMAALMLRNLYSIPPSIGIALLLYVGILTIMANSYQLGLSWIVNWLPNFGYEFFHVILFVLTLLWLIILVQRRY